MRQAKKILSICLSLVVFAGFFVFFSAIEDTHARHDTSPTTCDEDDDHANSWRRSGCSGNDMYDGDEDAPAGTTYVQLADTLADLDLDGYPAQSWAKQFNTNYDPSNPLKASALWEPDKDDQNGCVHPGKWEGVITASQCSALVYCGTTCLDSGCSAQSKDLITGRVPAGIFQPDSWPPPAATQPHPGDFCQMEGYYDDKQVRVYTSGKPPLTASGANLLVMTAGCKDLDASGIPVDNDLDGEANFGESTTTPGGLILNCPQEGGLVPCGRKTDDPFTLTLDETDPCTFCHFIILFNNVVSWIIWRIIPTVGLGLIILGGFLYATSRGSEGQLRKGRDLILWTLIGYAIILVAWTVMNSLFAQLGVAKWTGITGEAGNMEFASSCSINSCTAYQDTDKNWAIDEWKGLIVTLEHANWSVSKTAVVARNDSDTLSLEAAVDTEGDTIGGISYKIGGWWQFQCGE